VSRHSATPTPAEALARLRSAVDDVGLGVGARPLSELPPEPYVAIGTLANEMVRLARSSANTDFRGLFTTIEELLAGPPATRNLLIVGMLEDLQTCSLSAGLPLERWNLFLGPRTREAWQAVIDMWAGRRSAKDFNHFVDGGASLRSV